MRWRSWWQMKKVDCPRMTFISLTDRKHIQAMRTVPNMHQASSGPYYRNVYVAWNNELQRVTYYTYAPLENHHRKGVCPVYMSVQRIKAVWQDGRTNVLHTVGQETAETWVKAKKKILYTLICTCNETFLKIIIIITPFNHHQPKILNVMKTN